MKEQIFHGGNFSRQAESFVMPKSLTLQAETPYAKDGEIVFMSDRKLDELVRQTEQAQTPDSDRVAHPDLAMSEFQELFEKWKTDHPQDHDVNTARTNQIMHEMGLHPTPTDVHRNAQLSDNERIEHVNSMLLAQGGTPLTPAQEEAILAAHYVGHNEAGKDGQKAGVYNYTQEQILRKSRLLNSFTPEQRRALMEAGFVGDGGAFDFDGGGAYEGPGNDYSRDTVGGATETPLTTEGISGSDATLEQIQTEDPKVTEQKASQERLTNLHNRVNNITDPENLREFIDQKLAGHVERIGKRLYPPTGKRNQQVSPELLSFAERYDTLFGMAKDAIRQEGVDAAKQKLITAIDALYQEEERYINEVYADGKEKPRPGKAIDLDKPEQIHNMLDVAKSIIETDPSKWGSKEYNRAHDLNNKEAGTFPIINEDGSVHQANFIRWVREKMVEQHNFDPDSPINFFTAVGVENPNTYRAINLQTMTQAPGIYFRDANGKMLTELRDEVTNLAWLGGTARNMDVQYRQEMSNDSRFADMLVGLFKSNTFGKENTKGINTLASLFTMDEEYGSGDMKLGTAMRSAYLVYYHMTDPEKIKSLFPENFTLYNKDEMKAVIDGLRKDAPESEFLKEAKLDKIKDLKGKDQDGDIWDFYGEDGKIKADKLAEFAALMNVFSPPTKNRTQIQIFRGLISRAAARHAGLVKKDNPTEIDDENAGFPELMAYLMTYWTGAASRQDVTFAGLNAFTKVEHFKGYLYKQADPSRAGGIGNVRQVDLLNKITVDPMLGVLTTKGETTLEQIEKMQEISNRQITEKYTEKQKQDDLEKLRRSWSYDDRAWSQYAPQHVGNGFKEFHDRTSGKQVKFESFVHYEIKTGRITYDTDKMISEVQESIIKPTRYRWSTQKINYDYEQRVLQVKGKRKHHDSLLSKIRGDKHHDEKESKTPKYETQTTAEAMFGPQVLLVAQEILMHEEGVGRFLDSHGKALRHKVVKEDGTEVNELTPEARAALKNKEFGRVVSKAYLICKFATMLYYNTTRKGPGHLLDVSTRELIIRGIGSVTAGVYSDPENFQDIEPSKKYFTHFDLQILRRLSENRFGQNMWRQARADLGGGFLSGFTKGLKHTAKEIKI